MSAELMKFPKDEEAPAPPSPSLPVQPPSHGRLPPEWPMLRRAFMPALIWCGAALFLLVTMLAVPGWVARVPDGFHPAPVQSFVWTRIEKDRFRSSSVVQSGALVARLEPWREIPAKGVGSTGYDPGQRSQFEAALAQIRAAAALPQATLSRILANIGQGSQAAVLYHGALALYVARDLDEAEARAQQSLDKIKAGRPGHDDAARMRLDGEEASAAYLLGHIRLQKGDLDGAIKAFDEARRTAIQARTYPAYRTVSDPLFSLDPRFHLTDLSVAELWNDYLVALNRKNAETARAAAAPLYGVSDAVLEHPALAATLQVIAAEAGEPDRVSALTPDWTAHPAESYDLAKRSSAAARLVMGDTKAMSELEGSPDRDLFAPWVRLARERKSAQAQIGRSDPQADDLDDLQGDQRAFVSAWRAQYLKIVGADLLKRASAEHQKAYYSVILQARVFPSAIGFSAATHWWGLNPWWGAGIVVGACAVLLALLIMGWVFYETFASLHFNSRVRSARRRAADPLAGLDEDLP
jgi:tetratricopeptide (TPR) repeat protein